MGTKGPHGQSSVNFRYERGRGVQSALLTRPSFPTVLSMLKGTGEMVVGSWSAHVSPGAWLWEGPQHPNLGLPGKPQSAIPQNSLPPGPRHTAFRPRQLADGVPPSALAIGKFEVADPRGIRLQRKRGWWWFVRERGGDRGRMGGQEAEQSWGSALAITRVVQGGTTAQGQYKGLGRGHVGWAECVHQASNKHCYQPCVPDSGWRL